MHSRDIKLQELHSQTLTEALHSKLGSCVHVIKHHTYRDTDNVNISLSHNINSSVDQLFSVCKDIHQHFLLLSTHFHSPIINTDINQTEADRPVISPCTITRPTTHSSCHTSACCLPCSPITLLTTMMCPPLLFFISGITSLIMRITPKKFVSNTFFISSMGMLSNGPTRPIPALLTGQEKIRKQGRHLIISITLRQCSNA